MLRITALMDDRGTEHLGLVAEHGLSFAVEYGERRLLFDCGASSRPLDNAHCLGIDLHGLDAVVLSHSHYDHAAGYRFLVEKGLGSDTLYTGPQFFEPKYARSGPKVTDLSAGFDAAFLAAHGIRHQAVEGTKEIFPGVWVLSGFPRVHGFETIPARFVRRTEGGFVADDFGDEICLALRVEDGLVVLVGCSHPGILNMMDHVSRELKLPILAVYGGTHLMEADEKRVEETVQRLKEMGLKVLGLSHCSGEKARCLLEERKDVASCWLGVGDTVFY